MNQRFGKLAEVTKKNTVKRQIKDSKGKILQDSEEIIK